MVLRRVVASFLTIGTLLAILGCTRNAVTGESSLLFLSKDQEKQMGAEAAPQMTQQFGGAVPNQQLQDYVSRVGHKLAAQTEQDFPSFPWEFTLVNSDVINAFALPGGKIFITRGLAALLTNEAELAGVLGHECGHVTARHANQQISQSQLLGLGVGAVEAGVGLAGQGSTISQVGQYGIPALKLGSNVFLLRYGRKDESQADELGMRYMSRAGYNPKAQREVMEVLQKATESAGREPEWLSTHPYPETRIQQIDTLLGTQYKDWQSNAAYGFYEKEYHDQFLSVLATLPPAPKAPDADAAGAQGLQGGKKRR
jgi:predicted Zn-dependent protease